jgi:hypothetical protein
MSTPIKTSEATLEATLEAMPVELMSMIVKATGGDSKPILSAADVSSLRLASRRTYKTSFDAFGQRFMTTRKYMLSRSSLGSLAATAADPNLGSMVREVAIGPERINTYLDYFMRHHGFREEGRQKNFEAWEKKCRAAWRALVAEQATFEAGGEIIESLTNSFRALTNLRKVRLDGFPETPTVDAWTGACGTKSVLRQLDMIDSAFKENPGRAFINEDWSSGSYRARKKKFHAHYNLALQALYGTADKKDWTLDITLNGFSQLAESMPIDLHTPYWQAVRERVRSVTLISTGYNHTLPDLVFDKDWLSQFLQDCSNIESLHIGDDDNAAWVLRNFTFPKLRHLVLEDNRTMEIYLHRFLTAHANTLESITCDHSTLEIPAPPNSSYICQVYQEPGDLTKVSAQRVTSWFSIFKLMHSMPRLKSVHFAHLVHHHDTTGRGTKNLKSNKTLRMRGAELLMTTEGDEVVRQLESAIDASIFNIRYQDYSHTGMLETRSLKVWFPKTEWQWPRYG